MSGPATAVPWRSGIDDRSERNGSAAATAVPSHSRPPRT